MTLQCIEKLYLGTVYSGKQRNIYEHIYKFIPPFIVNAPHTLNTQWLKANCLEWKYKKVLALRKFQGNISTLKTKLSGPTGTPDKGNIFTNILYSGAASNTVKKYIKIDKDMIMLQDNAKNRHKVQKTEAARPELNGN